MNSSEVLTIAKNLIARASVTPDDNGCQKFIAEQLSELNFDIEYLNSKGSLVSNLWALKKHHDDSRPVLIFAGHTDVVPTGPLEQWDTNPFEPIIKDNILYGRGAADMKGSVAAMVVAVKNFITKNPSPNISIGLLLTSDEEGPAIYGTAHAVKILKERNQTIDYCIVGEPSSEISLGDTAKNGRRGSLTGNLTIYGTQGHVAYPTRANNAIHISLSFLQEITSIKWDNGNSNFPPTSFQIVNISAGTGATNVIPGQITLEFNLRYASCYSYESLTTQIEQLLNKYQLTYKLNWTHYAQPFITLSGKLTHIIQNAVQEVTNQQCRLATTGGTSDGRFIAPTFGCELVEIGPINNCIHKVNEFIDIKDLEDLVKIYESIILQINNLH